jgi:hypothetical protein
LAHDNEYGFINCYFSNHCRQDTLVFAVVVAEDDDAYTIEIQKALRSRKPIPEGTRVRITKTGWRYLWTKATPKINQGIVVSYLAKDQYQPYQPLYLVPSKTTDWRTMKVDTNRYYDYIADVERFVQSGGNDGKFVFVKGDVYRRNNGNLEKIIPIQRSAWRNAGIKRIVEKTIYISLGILTLIICGIRVLEIRRQQHPRQHDRA